jgi:hypothetical protein
MLLLGVRLQRVALELASPRSPEWREVRDEHVRLHPFCAACGGDRKLQVHHILPFHLHPDLELDPENLLTLCERPARFCHYVFGHFHNWKAYNPNVVVDAARYLSEHSSAPLA